MLGLGRKTRNPISFLEHAPEGLVDLHAHVLYGLDHGARDIEESISMLEGLSRLGFSDVVATPHFDCDEGIPDARLQLPIIDEIEKRATTAIPRLFSGAESLFDDRFLTAESAGKVPTVGRGAAYLVELGFTPGCLPIGIDDAVFKLRLSSKLVVIAHPERCPDLQRDFGRLSALRSAGAIVQIDLMSLVGRNESGSERAANRFLSKGLADVASTDIHRREDLGDIEKALGLLVDMDKEMFRRLLSSTPRRILDAGPDMEILNE